jgi:cyclophilin family peptidyl-prolyl cis-trans isomerase
MTQLSSGASISGSPAQSNNNNNSLFLGGLGVTGMMADQYQLTNSMQEHLLHKYSEMSTSPSNHSNYLQSSDLVGNGSVATGAGSYVAVARGRPTPSQLQLQTPPPHSSQTTMPNFMSDLNGLTMPITIMQHNLQHSSLHMHQSTNHATSTTNTQATSTIVQNPTVHVYPIYFFDIEINGNPFGRILIEVRNDVAPKMSKNFSSLATMELGFGYKGCSIFQCWENESIITGDFELNNGRGGRSVFEESFFMPDDTKILAIRGSVGMRRSQKRHDNMGLVGSQFRIILREMRGFTGIFAFVVEGLDLVDKISKTGDSAGKPQSNVIIVNCGKWQ